MYVYLPACLSVFFSLSLRSSLSCLNTLFRPLQSTGHIIFFYRFTFRALQNQSLYLHTKNCFQQPQQCFSSFNFFRTHESFSCNSLSLCQQSGSVCWPGWDALLHLDAPSLLSLIFLGLFHPSLRVSVREPKGQRTSLSSLALLTVHMYIPCLFHSPIRVSIRKPHRQSTALSPLPRRLRPHVLYMVTWRFAKILSPSQRASVFIINFFFVSFIHLFLYLRGRGSGVNYSKWVNLNFLLVMDEVWDKILSSERKTPDFHVV